VNPEFSRKGVSRAIDVVEVDHGIDRSEEGPVQPTTTLRDEFWDLEVPR
jgi:hypothetical protein